MRRALGALSAAAALAVATLGPVAPAVAADGDADEVIASMGACFTAAGQGDIVLLLDQSGSLGDTDPQGARVAAAQALVEDLAAFADRQRVELSVDVVGFSVDYGPAAGWQALSGVGLADVQARVAEVAAVDDGFDTDYWNAFDGARRDLRERADARGEASGCQALLFFTDGEYDVEPRDSARSAELHGTTKGYAPGADLTTEDGAAAAEAAGIDQLCNDRLQGPVSSLRSDGVYLVGVGLRAPGAADSVFDVVRGIATGSGGSTYPACGVATVPQTGAFFDATDIDALAFAFNALGSPDSTPTDIADDPLAPGASSTKEFVLDASIRSAVLLVGADTDGVRILLEGPDAGTAVEFTSPALGGAANGQQQVGSVPVAYEWITDRTVRLTLEQGDLDGWTGPWRVTWVSTAAAEARVRGELTVAGDLRPALVEAPDPVRAGVDVPLRLGVERPDGAVVDASEVQGSALLTADLVLVDGTVVRIVESAAIATLQEPVLVDLSTAPIGPAVLRLGLAVTTAASGDVPGTALAPQTTSERLQVVPPTSYPSVAGSVVFPESVGLAPSTATVAVTGPGCVWVSGAEVTARPEGVTDMAVTAPDAGSQERCMRLDEGQTADLLLQQVPGQQGAGGTGGVVSVSLASAEAAAPVLTTEVPFSGELRREVNVGVRAAALIAALVLGLGLPPLFLVLVRRVTSRIPGGSGGLWAVVTDVRVAAGRITDLTGGPPRLGVEGRQNVGVPPVGAREAGVPGTPLLLRVRDGLNPFAVPTVRATAGDGRPVVSGTAPHQDGRGAAVLPLAVQDRWLALRSAASPDAITVVLLVAGAATTEDLRELADDVQRRLPDLVGRLPALPGAAAPVGAVSSWDGSPAGPPPPGRPPSGPDGW